MSDASSLPLTGITVAEFGEWVAVPFAAKLLADLGADVCKFERETGGDPTRCWPPFPADRPSDPEASAIFSYFNTNKQSWLVSADAAPADVVRGHGQAFDIIFIDQSFLGSDPQRTVSELRAASPTSVVVTITPFGIGGPYEGYRGYDITCSAAGGISYGVGERNRPPLPLPFGQSDRQAGLCAASAALMGVLDQRRRTVGQHVDLSVHQVMAALHCGYFLPRYIFSGGVVGLRNGRAGGAQPYPHTVLPCKDGLVTLVAPKIDQWLRFLALMGNPSWAEQPRYRNRRAMQWEYKEEVDALLIPWFADKTKSELLELFLRHRIPFAPILDGRDLAESEHLRVRNALCEHELPGGGKFLAPASPFRFSRSASRSGRAPRLGEHGRARTVDASVEVPTSPTPTGDPAAAPLAGIRVLDLGTAWAGGIVGRILGDFGADVIKVESWSHMDGSRMGKPIMVDDTAGGDRGLWPDLQPGFHVHGRSKRSITLNLRSPEGMELLLGLVAKADVLIHNFTPRVSRSLRLHPERLLSVNDKLIVVGQSVAGDGGPLSDYTGYASTVASLAGFAQGIGYEGEEPVASMEGIYTDVISATMTVYGVLVGLVERQASGRGQAIDVSQWEALMALAPEPLVEYSTTGRERRSEGFAHPLLCPHGNYPTRHDPDDETQTGAWVSIAVGSDDEWRALLGVLASYGPPAEGAADWTLEDRKRNRALIDTWLAGWTATVDVDTVQRELQAAGVAAFRVANIADVFVDEQLNARGTWISLDHPLVGSEPMPGLPWNYSDAPCSVTRRAPLLGEHSREVLSEVLGIDDRKFEELVASGAIETRENAVKR